MDKIVRRTNIFTAAQVKTITFAINASAFGIALEQDPESGLVAELSSGGKPVFRVNFSEQVLSRYKSGSWEVAFSVPKRRWWQLVHADSALWSHLEEAIRLQGELGIDMATTNLFRREEIDIIIEAIRGMVFKIDTKIDDGDIYVLRFEEREILHYDRRVKTISLVASGGAQIVYAFQPEPKDWFWSSTDRDLLKRLDQAIDFYKTTIHRVRMNDFRQLFGRQIQEVLVKLAALMDEAEAEARMLSRVDSTGGGASLHPQVAQLVQKDLDSGEERAAND